MESGLTSSQKATFGAAWEILCAHRAVFLSEATGTGKTITSLNSLQTITANDVKNGVTYLSVMQSNLETLKTVLKNGG